ncbi:hypothetical protein BGZ65_002031, partial [Modicella reniformis]
MTEFRQFLEKHGADFSPLDFMRWMPVNFPEHYPTPSKQLLHEDYTRLSRDLEKGGDLDVI